MVLKQHKELGLYTDIDATQLSPMSLRVSEIIVCRCSPIKQLQGLMLFSFIRYSPGWVFKRYHHLRNYCTRRSRRRQQQDSANAEVAAVHWHIAFQKLNFQFDRNDIDALYERFVQIADSKKEVEDADLTVMALEHQQKTLATA